MEVYVFPSSIQYDSYKNTKDVLKSIHNEHEDRLENHLISQGSFFSNMIDKFSSIVNPLWSTARRQLPKNIFNFSVRYISNSLPNRTNLTKWGISLTPDCSFYFQPGSLLHVVAGCRKYLEQGRYTWRHDSTLHFLAKSFLSIQNSFLYADIPDFISSSALTGDSLRPDLLLVTPDKCLYLLELTVGFETNLRNSSHRKQLKYEILIKEQQQKFNEFRYVNLSMSALGVFDQHTSSFLDMLKDLRYDITTRNDIIKRAFTIPIRTTYYMLCRCDKDRDSPKLLMF